MIHSYIQLHKNYNDGVGGFFNFHIFQTKLKQCHIPPVLHCTSPAGSLLLWQHALLTLHTPHSSGLSQLTSCPGLQCQTTNSAMLLLASVCRSVSVSSHEAGFDGVLRSSRPDPLLTARELGLAISLATAIFVQLLEKSLVCSIGERKHVRLPRPYVLPADVRQR